MIKIAINTTLKLWSEQTVRQWPRPLAGTSRTPPLTNEQTTEKESQKTFQNQTDLT